LERAGVELSSALLRNWNDGTRALASGSESKMEKRIAGNIRYDREVNKVNINNFLIKTNIPISQRSIIPRARRKLRPQKTPFILNKS
jgi:hypothetical protein